MSLFDYYMETYNSDVLKEWVDLCGSPKGLTRKADRAEFLVRTMTSAQEVRRLWGEMDDLSRKAVAAAYHNEGSFHADAFIAQYGSLPARARRNAWSWYGNPILMDLFMPDNTIRPEIMPLLAPLVPEPERFRLEGVAAQTVAVTIGDEQIPCTIAQREDPGRRDLLALLSLANQGVLRFNSTGSRLTPKSAELLQGQLAEGDFAVVATADGEAESIICFGLPMFALQAGLVTSQGKLTPAGTRYLATEDPDLLLEAFEHWSETGDFDAVTRLQALRGLRARGVRLTRPAERNQRIVEALSWCPAGVWIALQDFYRAVKIWHFDFEIEQDGLEKLYVGYSGYNNYGEWASTQDMWLLTNGLYINAVLWETLGSIGALDVAYVEDAEGMFPAEVYAYDESTYSRYDGLMCFRINPLGAFLFGQADVYVPSRPVDAALFSAAADGRITLLPAALPLRRTPGAAGADRRSCRRRLSAFGAKAAGAAGDGAKPRPAARFSWAAQPGPPAARRRRPAQARRRRQPCAASSVQGVDHPGPVRRHCGCRAKRPHRRQAGAPPRRPHPARPRRQRNRLAQRPTHPGLRPARRVGACPRIVYSPARAPAELPSAPPASRRSHPPTGTRRC